MHFLFGCIFGNMAKSLLKMALISNIADIIYSQFYKMPDLTIKVNSFNDCLKKLS